jgi:hypothetical protein
VVRISALAFVLAGAIVGWFLAAHQVAFVRIMAPFWGALGALAFLSVVLAFGRAFAGLLGMSQPPEPPKLDPDWRATARRNMERMHRNGEFMVRRAWLIALLTSVVTGGISLAASRDAATLIFVPIIFLGVFVICRFEGKLFARMSPMPKSSGDDTPPDSSKTKLAP